MTTNKYSYIRLEPSDNGGAILTYDERVADGKGPYDGCSTVSRKEVYTKDTISDAVTRMFSMMNVTVKIEQKPMEMEHEKEIKVQIG